MTARPVTGFLASDGTFFAVEHLCRHYDATLRLSAAINKHPVLSVFTASDLDNIQKQVVMFMTENEDTIREFLDTLEPALFNDQRSRFDEANLRDSIEDRTVANREEDLVEDI